MTRIGIKRRKGLCAALSCALIVLAPAASNVAAAQGKKPNPLYWGALIGSQLTGEAAPWDMGAVTAFESYTRKSPSLIQFSAPFSNCYESPCSNFYFPALAMQNIRERGAIPFFNWASQSIPSSLNQPGFRLKRIASGALDPFIRAFAEGAREWGHPFFLRFNWEMNGQWFPWGIGVNHNTAKDYVAAWRHVWNIFQQVGATNATWVWCPNVDFTRKLTPLNQIYPGGKYVDWTCLDGFNWGDTKKSAGWMSFNEIFRETYERVLKLAPNKPMVIGETASEERGGSKGGWIKHMLRMLPESFPKVRALIYFDERDQGMNWPLESSAASANAFAQGISRSIYRPAIYNLLPEGKVTPPTWGPPPQETPPPLGSTEPAAAESLLRPVSGL